MKNTRGNLRTKGTLKGNKRQAAEDNGEGKPANEAGKGRGRRRAEAKNERVSKEEKKALNRRNTNARIDEMLDRITENITKLKGDLRMEFAAGIAFYKKETDANLEGMGEQVGGIDEQLRKFVDEFAETEDHITTKIDDINGIVANIVSDIARIRDKQAKHGIRISVLELRWKLVTVLAILLAIAVAL